MAISPFQFFKNTVIPLFLLLTFSCTPCYAGLGSFAIGYVLGSSSQNEKDTVRVADRAEEYSIKDAQVTDELTISASENSIPWMKDTIKLWGIEPLQQISHGADYKLLFKTYLSDLLKRGLKDGAKLMCKHVGKDKQGNRLSVCFLDNLDINTHLVSAGFAQKKSIDVSPVNYDVGGINYAYSLARQYKIGLWAYE